MVVGHVQPHHASAAPSSTFGRAPGSNQARENAFSGITEDGRLMDTQKVQLLTTSIEAAPFEIPGATGEFRIQLLNEDQANGVVTSIVHLPAGGRIPAHRHDAGSEMHYVLEGDLVEAGETLETGAFLTHAAGVVHGPHESRGGAKVLTVQTWQSRDGKFDFHLAEAGGAGETSSSQMSAKPPETESPAQAEEALGKGYG